MNDRERALARGGPGAVMGSKNLKAIVAEEYFARVLSAVTGVKNATGDLVKVGERVRDAIIVILTDEGEEIKHITSGSGKHIRYSGSSHSKTPEGLEEVTSEDQRDRKFGNQLNRYYHEVIAALRGAESVQIFGPGEAKGELKKTP